MIVATVISCPQRWTEYQRLRRNFDALKFPFSLRTFQTEEGLGSPYVNNNLNARAAIAYAAHRLASQEDGWLLYLEDDVVLTERWPAVLAELVRIGSAENVDCWYLCNRKNEVKAQYRREGLVLNELAYPIYGGHALLVPGRHLKRILDSHWATYSDLAIFAAINHPSLKVFQVVDPVLAEHVGEFSTYAPQTKRELEINYAD